MALALSAVLLITAACQQGHASLPAQKRLETPSGPPATLPHTTPYTGPLSLIVISAEQIQSWGRQYPGSALTVRAIQGLVNRDVPRIFVLEQGLELHDSDWLDLVANEHRGTLVTHNDSDHRVNDLAWYFQAFRSNFAGYLLFDASGGSSAFESINVAISLAGALDAIPIDVRSPGLIAAAKQAGLTQLADARGHGYSWLRASPYWSQLNRSAIYMDQLFVPNIDGADYAIAERMAAFQDDPRNDPSMQTMAEMLQDQLPGGIVFGYGYTDSTYGENVFVQQASIYDQSVMDTPSNLTVYIHFPAPAVVKTSPPPAVPSGSGKHYVAFVYSDGDNPRVILAKLTQRGADRWDSPLRGSIPMGWTVPPTMAGYAPIVLSKMFAEATPDDYFVAGPSGLGYSYPSATYDKTIVADQTQNAMAAIGLNSVLDLDGDGNAGFSHAAMDTLMGEPAVKQVFFTAYNGINQPALGSVLWSHGKPALPMYVVFRRPGQPNEEIARPAAQKLNSLPTDDSSAAAYTVVYLDFWSISMHDVAEIIRQLNPNVEVVRPDVLAELVTQNVAH